MTTPGVNFKETKTNHILEMEEVLGIEAARQTIINEIKYTMESHGMHIDIRHI
jgi:DNA-directed RNA polymerase III subunit RPC1